MEEERLEALMRIPIGIVSGIILALWGFVVRVVVVINFISTLITTKRNRDMADFCNKWVTFAYNYVRYITFATNKRPFPFNKLGKDIEKVDLK